MSSVRDPCSPAESPGVSPTTPGWMLDSSALGGGVSHVRRLPVRPRISQPKATSSNTRRAVADHAGSQGERSTTIAASGLPIPNTGGRRYQ